MSESAPKKANQQELANTFRTKQGELENLAAKITELEQESEEHALVIETIGVIHEKDKDRTCFRMTGGVLVERTVSDVLPELVSNREQIVLITQSLIKEYKKAEDDLIQWQKDNKVIVRSRA